MSSNNPLPHTPGPWVAPSAGIWTKDGECMIAAMGGRDCVASRRKYAREHMGDTEERNAAEMAMSRGDAQLIASAPDMLQALTKIAEQAQKGIERNQGHRNQGHVAEGNHDALETLAAVKGLALDVIQRATEIEERRTIYTLPNGRELRCEKSGMWAVQPPRDNYWEEATTPQEALDKAGWNISFESLVNDTSGHCEDEPSIAP
jgi:hypothetical protein